jgi:hypothetical protein
MKSSALIQGTREDLRAELAGLREEAADKGKSDKAAEFAAALAQLADDAPYVRVRHAVYRVVRDEDDWM